MSNYESVLSAASQLPVDDRLRLIDELASQYRTTSHRSFQTRGFERSTGGPIRSTRERLPLKIGWRSARDCSQSTVLTVRISFHPEATAELEASADWYAERSPTAARNFCVAVDLALASIDAESDRFVRIDKRHRACNVQKFPFQIVFRHTEGRIHVRHRAREEAARVLA